MTQVDYLIVGNGLAGSLLGYNLIKAGKSIRIIDANETVTSSKVAAGIYNPITGRRMVKTWMADQLFPYLESFYAELETELNTRFLFKKPVFRPFDTIADQNYWNGQSSDAAFKNYIQIVDTEEEVLHHYHAPLGGFYTSLSGYIQVKTMLDAFESYFAKQGFLESDEFDFEQLVQTEMGISYKKYSAKAVIFCQGYGNRLNPFFNYLPIEPTKGQVLDVQIHNYSILSIVNKRVFILPENGFQRVGSTYERDFTDLLPDESAKLELSAKLEAVLKSSYTLINHRAAVRPTVVDRKPLLGRHPIFQNMFIFNGLGTKGVSVSPYFSNEMAQYLISDKPLLPEVDIRRFDYLYQTK